MPIDMRQLLALLQQGAPKQGAPQQAPVPGQESPMDLFNKITMPSPTKAPNAGKLLGDEGQASQQIAPGQLPPSKPTPPSPQINPYAGMSAGMGFGGPSADILRSAPKAPDMPHDQRADASAKAMSDLFAKVTGNATPPTAKPAVMSSSPPVFSRQEKSESPDFEGPQLPSEGEPAQFSHPEQPHELIQQAASEFISRGVQTPEQADNALMSEFQDDPEIESAIATARQRYAIAQARSAKPPGVMEYVGYVLSTLAGANPMQAAEAISRRGEKREDEHRALQDLLGAQGMKVKDRQQQRQLGIQDLMSQRKVMADQQEGDLRQQNRAEDKNFDRLKAGRGASLQRMNQLQQAVNMSNNPKEKQALQQELDMLKRRTQFFGRQLGEPEQDEQGNKIGMASPDAMRLLGLG